MGAQRGRSRLGGAGWGQDQGVRVKPVLQGSRYGGVWVGVGANKIRRFLLGLKG